MRHLIAVSVAVLAIALGLWLDGSYFVPSVSSTEQLRKLPAGNTGRAVPFNLMGNVTYSDGLAGLLVIQDSSGGVRLHQPDGANWPELGSLIQVSGSVASGGLNPAVTVSTLKQIRAGRLPVAKPVSFDEARSGQYEYQRIAVTGIARSVFIMERSGLLSVTIDDGKRTIKVRVHDYSNHDFRALVDSEVRAEGVLISSMDVYGRPSTSTLWIPDIKAIHVLTPAPRIGLIPVSRVSDVMRSEALTTAHRVRVRGVVRGFEKGRVLLRDASGEIALAPAPPNIQDGSMLDLAGFLASIDGHPVLTEPTVIESSTQSAHLPLAGHRNEIHTALAVHQLPAAVAGFGYPVHLTGVVTYFDPRSQLLFVQDQSAGIFVAAQGKKLPPVVSGDVVDVQGVTAPGGFAPVISKPVITVIRKGEYPVPISVDQEQIFSGKYDSQWIELPGVVRSVLPNGTESILTLSLGQHTFNAHVIGNRHDLRPLLDASVRLRGVCGSVSNERRQLLAIQMFVPSWNEVKVEQNPVSDAFLLPLRPVDSILQFAMDASLEHRVHVRGLVLLSNRLGPTWIADQTGGLMIADHGSVFLNPGDEVDAVGFQAKGALSPILTAADIKRLAPGHLPAPLRVVPDEATEGTYDSQYVEMEARLVEVMTGSSESSLLLQSGKTSFYAHVPFRGALARNWAPGAILRVRGVCTSDTDLARGFVRPRLFQLYLSSPSDVTVVRSAPIFSRDLALKALTLMGVTIFLSVLWIALLQRRVREQTHTIKQKLLQEAALKVEAQKASEAKGQFLANMSHEIRTPLNGIIGFTELTLGTSLTSEQKENLTTVQSSAVSLLQIVNDVLDFSKIEAGKMELHVQPFSIRSFAETAVRTIQTQAREHIVKIRMRVADDVPDMVDGDETRLRQVVLNLLGNSVKFTRDGEVRLEINLLQLEAAQASLEFVVADTGIGIPAPAQQQIFDPFQQADGSITRHYGGTGLGLAICKRIVTLLGGDITLTSEPNVGTTVRFRATFGIPDQARPVPEAPVQEPETIPLRILVAEDNAINRRLIERILERQGHRVSLAMNGLEAVDLFRQAQFDVVLMDVHMPEMDGLEATRNIRQLPTGADVPILAFTASAMQSELQRYLDAGMSGFLTKPFQLADLMKALSTHCRTPLAADGQPTVLA